MASLIFAVKASPLDALSNELGNIVFVAFIYLARTEANQLLHTHTFSPQRSYPCVCFRLLSNKPCKMLDGVYGLRPAHAHLFSLSTALMYLALASVQ